MDEPAAQGPPDAILVASIGLLVALGVTMVFSASSAYAVALHHDAAFFLKRQLAWLVAALAAALMAYRVDYRSLRKIAPFFLGASVVALILVFVPHVGVYVGGARRWIGFGALSFEPSEFAKLALVLYLAVLGLLLLQPDLGHPHRHRARRQIARQHPTPRKDDGCGHGNQSLRPQR